MADAEERSYLSWRHIGVVDTTRSPVCRLRGVPLRAVRMGDGFWEPRRRANRDAGIPRLLDLLEEHGVADNFRRLSGRKDVPRRGLLFTDSDLYKWMEAAAFSLQADWEDSLAKRLEDLIDEILAAQGPDGYLNTWFVDERAGDRFTRLPTDHELYCLGTLIQAAVAHHRATGGMTLLDGAARYADYVESIFGPGKREGVDGHPEVEMALVELYRATGERRYLELAGFFLGQLDFPAQREIEGHAVRAGYMCCGAADYAAETGDARHRESLERLWQDMVSAKMYITGGVGSRYEGEAFGRPYELPNARAYAETCAAIANLMWNWRMLLLTGEARFADVMERVAYNGFLSGVSLSGTEYFYVNPLACDWEHRRAPWFDCTCCPPNVARTLASLPGYFFSTSDEGVWVHLYDTCELDWRLHNGRRFVLALKTAYPWDGTVRLSVAPAEPEEFSLFLRIPSWCRSAAIRVNGDDWGADAAPGGYAEVRRIWRSGDEVVLDMQMPAEVMEADPRVRENMDCVALQRGPVVYCVESIDNPEISIPHLGLDTDGSPVEVGRFEPGLLGGIVLLQAAGFTPERDDPRPLYRRVGEFPPPARRRVSVTAIPYYAWANRGPSQMAVWLPRTGL